MDKIRAGFRILDLTVILGWGCTAADKLTCNVASNLRLWQCFRNSNNPQGKIDQALIKVKLIVILRHSAVPCSMFDILQYKKPDCNASRLSLTTESSRGEKWMGSMFMVQGW